jgi:FkbM family methyltransferase
LYNLQQEYTTRLLSFYSRIGIIKMGKVSSWLLKETVGVGLFDKCILLSFKLSYLFFRFLLTVFLGKRRRDTFYSQKGMGFNAFLFKTVKMMGLYDYIILRIKVPRYNYSFFCRSNNEDFTFMTGHEEEILKQFKPNSGDIVVDIGAHIGHHTLIAAQGVGPTGKVIAFEADPQNFEILIKNIKLNKFNENVITMNCAVSSKESKIKLYTPEKESGHTIYNTIMSDRVNPKEKFVEINANTLDSLLQENGIIYEEVKWLKIDVEGAELEVLKGAHKTLSEAKNITLIIEIHSFNLYKSIIKYLDKYNFKIEFEKGDGEWRHIIANNHI